MKIVLFEPDLFDNGALRVSLDRAALWRSAGHQVRVLVMHRHAEEGDQVDLPTGLDVRFATSRRRRPSLNGPLSLLASVRAARWADVVVAGREIGDGLLHAAAGSRLTRTPMAVTVQSRVDRALETYVPRRRQRLTKLALRSAGGAVCVAAGLVPVIHLLGVARSRVHVVTNGVDVPGVRARARERPDVRVEGSRAIVVASGRLDRQKGFDVLIRAHAAALAAGGVPHDLMVMGAGPDRDDLLALADGLGVAGSVFLPGFVQNPHAVVARATLFVLPSRWEGYPLALVEALALGVPVVASDCVSGPREVLDGERYGALVPVDDVAALASAIVSHLASPQDLLHRSAAARDVAEQRHDPAAAAHAHLEVLHGLASATAPHGTGADADVYPGEGANPPAPASTSGPVGSPHRDDPGRVSSSA